MIPAAAGAVHAGRPFSRRAGTVAELIDAAKGTGVDRLPVIDVRDAVFNF